MLLNEGHVYANTTDLAAEHIFIYITVIVVVVVLLFYVHGKHQRSCRDGS